MLLLNCDNRSIRLLAGSCGVLPLASISKCTMTVYEIEVAFLGVVVLAALSIAAVAEQS